MLDSCVLIIRIYESDESGSVEVYVQSFTTPGRKRTVSVGGGSWFDVAADRRFLVPTRPEETNVGAITVLLNWDAALKK